MKKFTEEDLERMAREREQENHETLYDIPLELCDDNAYEMPESENNYQGFADVEFYIGSGHMSHPFIARRKPEGRFEILGANEVLAAARAQGVKKLGTVCAADVADAKWLLMSYFTRFPMHILQGYHLYCKSLEMSVPLPWKTEQLETLELLRKFRNEWSGALAFPLTDDKFIKVSTDESRVMTWKEVNKMLTDIKDGICKNVEAKKRAKSC